MLATAGTVIAAYLAVVNLQGEAGACVATHGCSAVQNSSYGKILGVPVSVPGLAMYLALLAASVAWLVDFRGLRRIITLGAFNLSLFALLFSGYLTYVEGFVLDAWCIYCIVSAMLVSLLFLSWLALLLLAARENRPGS